MNLFDYIKNLKTEIKSVQIDDNCTVNIKKLNAGGIGYIYKTCFAEKGSLTNCSDNEKMAFALINAICDDNGNLLYQESDYKELLNLSFESFTKLVNAFVDFNDFFGNKAKN